MTSAHVSRRPEIIVRTVANLVKSDARDAMQGGAGAVRSNPSDDPARLVVGAALDHTDAAVARVEWEELSGLLYEK